MRLAGEVALSWPSRPVEGGARLIKPVPDCDPESLELPELPRKGLGWKDGDWVVNEMGDGGTDVLTGRGCTLGSRHGDVALLQGSDVLRPCYQPEVLCSGAEACGGTCFTPSSK